MLRTYLMENYGYNEPIFINDLSIDGMTDNAVRQAIKRLVAAGFLERYDNGIYYIPEKSGVLGKSYLDPGMVVIRKYVQSKSENIWVYYRVIVCQSAGVNNTDACSDRSCNK